MNSDYKQSVALFGLVLPFLFMMGLIGGVVYGKNYISKKYQSKMRAYNVGQKTKREVAQLEMHAAQQKNQLKTWESMLKQDSRRSFIQQWKKIGLGFKPKEFQFELPTWKNSSKGLGSGQGQQGSQVSMSFSSTYRAMQQGLLEMETTFPQMQLDSIQMNPNANGQTMNFNTTYTVWTQN